MAENKKAGHRGYFYDGRPHFSYDNSLIYHPHKFKAHETVQDMVKRAEQSMLDNQFKG